MPRKTKAEQVKDSLAASHAAALFQLLSFEEEYDEGPKGSHWTGFGFTSANARACEAAGCVKIVAQQKVGRGYKLAVKLTALGRKVAALQ
jgi:hypothetical protein